MFVRGCITWLYRTYSKFGLGYCHRYFLLSDTAFLLHPLELSRSNQRSSADSYSLLDRFGLFLFFGPYYRFPRCRKVDPGRKSSPPPFPGKSKNFEAMSLSRCYIAHFFQVCVTTLLSCFSFSLKFLCWNQVPRYARLIWHLQIRSLNWVIVANKQTDGQTESWLTTNQSLVGIMKLAVS